MNLISGFPCNITEELCYLISCCCYQCFVQRTGHCVGKLALGHKGGRMYPEEKQQALFDGLNGVWMQVAAPAGFQPRHESQHPFLKGGQQPAPEFLWTEAFVWHQTILSRGFPGISPHSSTSTFGFGCAQHLCCECPPPR